ncbi:MAG: PQQ-dependent sugar dehydrogenase [Hyphomicrobiaceae bacterium]
MSGQIFLETGELSVAETDGRANVAIVRTGDLSLPVTVQFATTPDTAGSADYVTNAGTVTIAAGETRVVVPVTILDDAAGEPTETFIVSLINVDSGMLTFPRTTRVNILDDENPVTDPVDPPLTPAYTVATPTVVSGLAQPIAFEFMPDDASRMMVAEKSGLIRVFDVDDGQAVSTVIDLRGEVNDIQDRGLLDIALHPDLALNPYLYAFYVVDPPDVAGKIGNAGPDGGGNRYSQLVRFELDPATDYTTVVAGSKTVMLGGAGTSLASISGAGVQDSTSNFSIRASDIDPVTGQFIEDYIKVDSRSHAGGSIEFGPDGALYVSTGDGTSYNATDPRTVGVQNVNSLAGKILRVDPLTGEGLADNPFVTPGMDLDSNAAKVWQLGLRNPFSMSFDAEGQLMIADTGWNTWEEVNSGGPGANYGWPFYEGGDNGQIQQTNGYRTLPEAAAFYAAVANGTIDITAAYRAFAHASGAPGYQVQAITGADDIVTSNLVPEGLKNDYIFTDVSQGEVFSVDVNDRREVTFLFKTAAGIAPVHFKQSPDGFIYYADLANGRIGRLDATEKSANIIAGTSAAETLAGTSGADVMRGNGGGDTFLASPGADILLGDRNVTDTVSYAGTRSDYTFTRDLQGNVTVEGATTGKDVLSHIERATFAGDGTAFAMASLAGAAGANVVTGTSADEYLDGTASADVMRGGDGLDVFYGGAGNDLIDGEGGDYNQIDLDGRAADYTFVRNADGTVTVSHPSYGTDVLVDIDGVWFFGEAKWYGLDALVNAAGPGGIITGTPGDDRLYGSNGDDTMRGGDGVDVFYSGGGDDDIDGEGGGYNQVDLDGAPEDYTFARNADGSITVSHPEYGTDTLRNIDGAWFLGEGQWYAIDALVRGDGGGLVSGTPGDDRLYGSNGNDTMRGGDGLDVFYGGRGDDDIDGEGGDYNQVDLDGAASEYTFTTNADGSVTMVHAEWGTDTLRNIDGAWFFAEAQWYGMDQLTGAATQAPIAPASVTIADALLDDPTVADQPIDFGLAPATQVQGDDFASLTMLPGTADERIGDL